MLEVGDMLVYSGCELEHWREPFDGNICGQVFLHYNHVNGPFAEKNRFDGRPMLGPTNKCNSNKWSYMLQKLGFAPGFNKQVTKLRAEAQWT